MDQTVEGQVQGQGFNWKQVVSGLASSIPHVLAALNNRSQALPIGAVSQNPVSPAMPQSVERVQNSIAKAKGWLGPNPLVRIAGIYLMADGTASILAHEFRYLKDKTIYRNRKKHIWRLVRIGIGYYMVRMK